MPHVQYKIFLLRLTSLTFLLLISFTFNNIAFASGGYVQALQMPAWLNRSGQLSPLKPGIQLASGDKIITGLNARLLLVMDDRSMIKLGENTELNFDRLIPAEEEQGFFEATLQLIKGAFRYTTTESGKSRRRLVEVRIGSITAGIRGTDIWGSSHSDKDILCLIEGVITANRAGEPEFTMQQPLSFYRVPKNKPALPVTAVTQNQLAGWANETEMQAAAATLNIDGVWTINLMSVTRKSTIKPIFSALVTAGYAAEIQTTMIKGKQWFRLRINNFKSREDAQTFAANITGTHGITQPWVLRNMNSKKHGF